MNSDPKDTEDMTTMTAAELDTAATHIAGLRERLDEIDAKLIELWQERARISQEVGRTRVASGGTRLVLNRENEILDMVARGWMTKEESRPLQKMVRRKRKRPV